MPCCSLFNPMGRLCGLVFVFSTMVVAQGPVVAPFEVTDWSTSAGKIDELVLVRLEQSGIKPARPCSDEVFLRRVYLDMTGTLPQPAELQAFMRDNQPGKRAALIELLFKRDEFAEYWALKWCDLLRVKAEFPINLWPNAVQAYHRWIRDALRSNMPYDQFVRELLTSSGSNFRVPPVNFYRAIQGRQPGELAAAAALTFMGARIGGWPKADQDNLALFFSKVAYKSTAEWKEEIVYMKPDAVEPLDVTFPDGVQVVVAPDQDPRKVFAAWLVARDNPWFARNIVNRVWSWLMGRGIIHEADDIRPDNLASNPELLEYLERELLNANYDLRHMYRLILNSRTYQQSSIPRTDSADAEPLFACYPVRRLDAEVLIDALCWITGTREGYQSPIPEPFTFIPDYQRSVALADGSITSSFLEMFGRPPRDTGLESERLNQPTDAQRLHLLNSSNIQRRIQNSWRIKNLFRSANKKPGAAIIRLYETILTRKPTDSELQTVKEYVQTAGLQPKQAAEDLAWALINTKEFLYRH